jgi:hypothetical protein
MMHYKFTIYAPKMAKYKKFRNFTNSSKNMIFRTKKQLKKSIFSFFKHFQALILVTDTTEYHFIIPHYEKIYDYAKEAFETFQWLDEKFYEHDKTAPTEEEYKQAENQLAAQIDDGLKSQRFDQFYKYHFI